MGDSPLWFSTPQLFSRWDKDKCPRWIPLLAVIFYDARAHFEVGPCMAATGGLLSSGMTVAFPSAMALQPLPELSWIGSASHLAMIAGSLAIGPVLDTYGRKAGLILALLLSFIGWSLLFMGGWMVGGRLLTGLSAGLSSAPVSVLIAEISSPRVRAVVTTFKHTAFSLGLFVMYCLRVVFQERWEKSAMCSAGTVLCCLVLVYVWVPETGAHVGSKKSYRPFLAALPSRPEIRGPFVLMTTLSALKQLSGTTVLLSYAVHMVSQTGLAQAGVGALCLGAVRLGASLLAAPLAGKMGRRSVATYGGYVSSLALLLLASGPELAMPILLTFVFTSALASSAIQALVGEVFLPEFRAVSTGLTTTAAYASAFAALHCYPWMLASLGFLRLLSVYAVISVLCTLISIFFLRDNISHIPDQIQDAADAETTIPLRDLTNNEGSIKV